jgi:Na+:H+ antiporter, NhaA family
MRRNCVANPSSNGNKTVFGRGSYPEYVRISELMRKETVGGILLLIATVAALVWANSPAADGYFAIRDFKIGFESLHLDLSIGHWASDGLLAIFFFLTGLELKREFVAGDLRSPGRAIVPIAAAFGGVAIPALVFVVINLSAGPEALRGWAIPTATDIAFAVAVLAVISSHLPSALRIFILTLAVMDDLIAIAIIAFFYSSDVQLPYLLWMLLPLALFAFLTHKFPKFFAKHHLAAWAILLPLGIVTWALMHSSGVHATVAGVLLGFAVPVLRREKDGGPDSGPGLAEQLEHRFRPLSTGFAVPVFAFFAAGVALGGWEGISLTFTDTVAIGTAAALVAGKPLGIMLTTWVLTKSTKATLDPSLKWIDVFGVAVLAGVGFTVSLLVNDLSFELGSEHHDHAKVAVLTGSLVSALLATVILRARNRHYRKIEELETADSDQDGIPDVYQQDRRATD